MSSESSPSLEETIRARYPDPSRSLIVRLNYDNPSRQRIIMIRDPIVQSMFVESLLPQRSNKDGPASIEAMPAVKITEGGSECPICFAEYEVGGEAKEMPCKHRYHSGCIEKWLRTHRSCPLCRFKMPVEEEEDESGKGGDGDD
ncbi:E3 ubiquitin-protein ligase MPSR1-like [Cornus florida]|uniref:E3 ubiquitin-protein ligase MPSR1-like n=1 Tax=Cornus florida TaxID=4283 RepID=UPI002896E12C|nr:E3 ubiquitin-protein ligase MPSR1-like [Cornus florida]